MFNLILIYFATFSELNTLTYEFSCKFGIMEEKIKQKEFLKAFEPVRERLYRFARALSKNDELARDIVSDTLLQAYENFDNLKEKKAFLSFVFTIASRTYKRYNWRRRIFGDYDSDYAENNFISNDKPDANYDIQMLYEALDKLNAKTKEAVILFEISGFSIKEISNLQKCTESAVKSRLKRGREKLEILLTEKSEIETKQQKIILKKKKLPTGELL